MRFGLNPFGKKKKRIPYDPPGSKARKKANKQANRRVDQLFLTRRAVMMKSAVLGGFSILLARLGYMQISKGEDYQAAATTNITDWRELKPSRGVIVDRKGRLMAKNRKSWSVSVIPADIRQLESTQLAYVREQLMTALRLPDVVMINPGSIPAEAKDQVYRRVGRLLGEGPHPLVGFLGLRYAFFRHLANGNRNLGFRELETGRRQRLGRGRLAAGRPVLHGLGHETVL